jgi:hypothetical protein
MQCVPVPPNCTRTTDYKYVNNTSFVRFGTVRCQSCPCSTIVLCLVFRVQYCVFFVQVPILGAPMLVLPYLPFSLLLSWIVILNSLSILIGEEILYDNISGYPMRQVCSKPSVTMSAICGSLLFSVNSRVILITS